MKKLIKRKEKKEELVKMVNEFTELGYAYTSLGTYIDEETMKVHHGKHYRAYFDKFMATIKGTDFEDKDVDEILSDLNSISEEKKTAIVNNGGGYTNHRFFWTILKTGTHVAGDIREAINKNFGSFDKFAEKFSEASIALFGSGWVWLVMTKEGTLEIIQTKNQDSPLSQGKVPLLCIDLWEHAYYLNYQNKRPDYVVNFFHVINWDVVGEYYKVARASVVSNEPVQEQREPVVGGTTGLAVGETTQEPRESTLAETVEQQQNQETSATPTE